ncbi:carbohydrate esterase family 1 protein [Drepanopeziza brunnea f. sp. 'multigermtubi' MB_m1]|uniref:Carboxylic ester hydrolase n=1 Tax=Marssonina brunnea f. sp. multigermtubi (strain MB_m1) TaxID=1072389 RepID=K1WWH2_MARBU|nr:carbohydrate esterase family 1 protein [Drepanopeziza brunnea f. sp. 'multigermtubi' MB_m1]EKD16847.1 carbohydrate esterase family 1 protein [Drepanopeziza brunnea f. sp. 'multigermtubi' MB_m1]
MRSISTLVVALASVYVAGAAQNELQEVTNFTAGPTGAKMYIYVPTTKPCLAPIVVGIHYCSGTAAQYFTNTQYANLADDKGFIVIYPEAPSSGRCWDVASTASLTNGQGGDSQTIVNMVDYAVKNYGGDPDRVFVTGTSSGAMMTNVLAGAYPNIFKAASAYSGVPDGCFAVAGAAAGSDTPGWNSECSSGKSIKSAQDWGDLARSYYPGYTGPRPKMMIWHGDQDTILAYPNLAETLKQWSNVLDVAFTKNTTDTPESGYTEMMYGDGTKLLGYSAKGVGHTVPVHATVDLAWFGIE